MLLIKQQVNERISVSINCVICLEQGENLKRQASDAGEKVASQAKNVKKQVEKQSEGAVGKLIHLLNDVKESVLGQKFSLEKEIDLIKDLSF